MTIVISVRLEVWLAFIYCQGCHYIPLTIIQRSTSFKIPLLIYQHSGGHYRGAVIINGTWNYNDALWERHNKGQGLKKCAGNVPSTSTSFLLSHCVYIASHLLQWLDITYFMYPLRTPQLILSKMDTFGAGSKCPSQRDVRLIKSQIKGVKKGRDQLQVSVLQRCPSYRGVR